MMLVKKKSLLMKLAGIAGAIVVLVGVFNLLNKGAHKAQSYSELVMLENSGFNLESAVGRISIEAGKGLRRSYVLSDCTIETELVARTDRTNGSLGAYDGSELLFSQDIAIYNCGNIKRAFVEEGQLHFAAYKDVHLWLNRQPPGFINYWTNDGLFVRLGLLTNKTELKIDVFQLCVSGKRADTFWQAQSKKFSWTPTKIRHNCARTGKESLVPNDENHPVSGLSLTPKQ